eukprot:6846384-Prymnesium_polylepis.1
MAASDGARTTCSIKPVGFPLSFSLHTRSGPPARVAMQWPPAASMRSISPGRWPLCCAVIDAAVHAALSSLGTWW